MEGLAIGRMVHYVSKNGVRAAVVTRVWGDTGTVNLFVFPDAADGYASNWLMTSIPYGGPVPPDQEAMPMGTWHWPPHA